MNMRMRTRIRRRTSTEEEQKEEEETQEAEDEDVVVLRSGGDGIGKTTYREEVFIYLGRGHAICTHRFPTPATLPTHVTVF
jgi:hypothetical protein